jgi:hypothetical protein
MAMVAPNAYILSAGGGRDQRHADGEDDKLGGVIQYGDQVAAENGIARAVFLEGYLKESRVGNKIENQQKQQRRHRYENLRMHKAPEDALLPVRACLYSVGMRHHSSPPAIVAIILF